MDFYCVTAPGLEPYLAQEAGSLGFSVSSTSPGGVTLSGEWRDVWRANLCLRGATRILARVAEFRAMHLAQLDKRARKLPWADWLAPDTDIRVDATCRKSRIYHNKAAAQRVERAITETLGCKSSKTAAITIKVRIEDDLCTVSLDTSGPSLHKRGMKEQVNKAPMRETLAALFLRAAGYDGSAPVYDPMCGSGTFPIEAAEMAAGLLPGRARNFAFEQLANFDKASFDKLKVGTTSAPPAMFFGTDRDAGAIKMSKANTERAGLSEAIQFDLKPISDITPPCPEPGLIIANPPYGGRIGNSKPLFGLYAALGARVKEHFPAWRIAIITSDAGLAKATGLPWDAPGPIVDHGGIKVRLWQAQL